MRYAKSKRILSLLLVLLFVVSLLPSAFAEEALPETVTEEPAIPAEDPAAETPAEQPVPEKELPEGIAGMPEGYVLSDAALSAKKALLDNGVLDILRSKESGKDYIEGEVLVTAATEEEAKTIAAAYNAELLEFEGHVALLRLNGISVPDAVAAGMDPAYNLPPVDPNVIVHLNPVTPDPDETSPDDSVIAGFMPERMHWKEWFESSANPDKYLSNPSGDYQYMHDMIDSFAAWGYMWGEHAPYVALIDSGVDQSHPDFSEYSFIHLSDYAWDYVDNDETPQDEFGQGTLLAGVIAAIADNGIGGAGIAPEAHILPIRVLDKHGEGKLSNYVKAVYRAADHTNIILLDIAQDLYSSTLQDAITYAHNDGDIVIAPMGDGGSNVKQYPAAMDNVVAVAAVNQGGDRAVYSNYGDWCDLAAPGSRIWTTARKNKYACADGTALAAAVVAGVAYLDQNSFLGERSKTEQRMKACTTSCKSAGCGKGIVNIGKMLEKYDGHLKVSPVLFAQLKDGTYFRTEGNKSLELPRSTHLEVEAPDPYYYKEYVTVYTLDGTNPKVANGDFVNGYFTEGWAEFDLDEFDVGDVVTLKAMFVTDFSVSKIATWKIKIVPENADTVLNNITVAIQDPKAVVSGKSVVMKASVKSGSEKNVNQTVTWSITGNSGCPGAAINEKTGKLTTKSTDVGYVTVKATSVANTAKSKTLKVYVKQNLPIGTITLSDKTLKIYDDENRTLTIATLKDSKGNAIAVSDRGFFWSSSNTKVAEVDQNGKVTAKSKGSAVITCQAMDGSGKKATCNVTVLVPLRIVSILVPNTKIASGSSMTMKAYTEPYNANDKALIWEIVSAPSGVTVSNKGVLKVPSSVTSGTVKLRARSHDGYCSDATDTVSIKIIPSKATWVRVPSYSDFTGPTDLIKKDKNGSITAVTLYSANTQNHSGSENSIKLTAKTSNNCDFMWTSKNYRIADVDPFTGLVTAVSAGTTTVTCTARDGSGKKATVKVTVVNPASSIFIQSGNPGYADQENVFLLAIGKTVSNKAVFGATYGKPTSQKVTWDFKVESYDDEGYFDYTSDAKKHGWVKLTSSGALTVKKDVYSYWSHSVTLLNGDIWVTVTATATDGSGVVGTAKYYIQPPVEQISHVVIEGINDAPVGKPMYMTSNNYGYIQVYASKGGWYEDYTATSSNPKILGVVLDSYEEDGPIFKIIPNGPTGTAFVTFKAKDGSGKSLKLKIQVVN